jgi:hypothetical protein
VTPLVTEKVAYAEVSVLDDKCWHNRPLTDGTGDFIDRK